MAVVLKEQLELIIGSGATQSGNALAPTLPGAGAARGGLGGGRRRGAGDLLRRGGLRVDAGLRRRGLPGAAAG